MREKSRERSRGRERERSKERVRERSPMLPSEGTSRKQPPDRQAEEQRLFGEVPSSIPSSLEIKVDETPSAKIFDQGVSGEKKSIVQEKQSTGETGNKTRRSQGVFSEENSLVRREEDWMNEEGITTQPSPQGVLSYREALKPKTLEEKQDAFEKRKEEAWDGYLYCSNEVEMHEGITITDTRMGPIIEFSDEEKRRLEKKWSKSLIIKLLGGAIGFMQMRRKVQLLWVRSGTVELNDIGNGFMIATFQSLDDYFFVLDGGPWVIHNHYLTVQTWKRNLKKYANGGCFSFSRRRKDLTDHENEFFQIREVCQSYYEARSFKLNPTLYW